MSVSKERVAAEAAVGALDAAIAGLFAARTMLVAVLDGEPGCTHRNRVSLATFTNPDGWMCPDCQEQG